MKESIYIGLLFAVLATNAALSFYHHHEVSKETESLRELVAFKDKGARYTFDDGVTDRAARDAQDAWLQDQINNLYNLCLGAPTE